MIDEYFLEYLGPGEIEVGGVGKFGIARFVRAKKDKNGKIIKPSRREKVTKLPCSERVAREFAEDERFKVYGLEETNPPLPKGGTDSPSLVKRGQGGVKEVK